MGHALLPLRWACAEQCVIFHRSFNRPTSFEQGLSWVVLPSFFPLKTGTLRIGPFKLCSFEVFQGVDVFPPKTY